MFDTRGVKADLRDEIPRKAVLLGNCDHVEQFVGVQSETLPEVVAVLNHPPLAFQVAFSVAVAAEGVRAQRDDVGVHLNDVLHCSPGP